MNLRPLNSLTLPDLPICTSKWWSACVQRYEINKDFEIRGNDCKDAWWTLLMNFIKQCPFHKNPWEGFFSGPSIKKWIALMLLDIWFYLCLKGSLGKLNLSIYVNKEWYMNQAALRIQRKFRELDSAVWTAGFYRLDMDAKGRYFLIGSNQLFALFGYDLV